MCLELRHFRKLCGCHFENPFLPLTLKLQEALFGGDIFWVFIWLVLEKIVDSVLKKTRCVLHSAFYFRFNQNLLDHCLQAIFWRSPGVYWLIFWLSALHFPAIISLLSVFTSSVLLALLFGVSQTILSSNLIPVRLDLCFGLRYMVLSLIFYSF